MLKVVTVALLAVCVALWGAYAAQMVVAWDAPPPVVPTPQVTPTAVPRR